MRSRRVYGPPLGRKHLRKQGGLCIAVPLACDAESARGSFSGKGLKTPTRRTLLGHIKRLQ
eukprot:1430099-Pyramimonas_sp.AAC.1